MEIIINLKELSTPFINSPFGSSLIGGLISGFIILALGSWIIPAVIDYRNRPQLMIIDQKTRKEEYNIFFRKNIVHLIVKNNGRKSITGVWYLNLIVPIEFGPRLKNVQEVEYPPSQVSTKEGGIVTYVLLSAAFQTPIYKQTVLKIPAHLELQPNRKISNNYIYYYLSTELGTYPNNAISTESININELQVMFEEGKLARILVNYN